MGLLVQLSDVHAYLNITFTTDDTLLSQIITSVSAAIETWCRRSFSGINSYTDILDGSVAALALLNRPIANVSALLDLTQRVIDETVAIGNASATSFTHTLASAPVQPGTIQIVAGAIVAADDGNGNLTGAGIAAGSTVNYSSGAIAINFTAAPASGTQIVAAYTPASAIVSPALYAIDNARGLLFPLPQPPANFPIPAGFFDFLDFRAAWGKGERRWQVNYTAGYANVPSDVQLATLMTIAARYNRRDALAQEEVGDYRYVTETSSASGFTPEAEQLLSPYREQVFA